MFYYEGIDNAVLTFSFREERYEEGEVCKITAEGAVAGCSSGDLFHGVVQHAHGGYASVVMKGVTRVRYSGTAPAAGFAKLVADGSGGVKVDATKGREYLVVNVDSDHSYIELFL